MKKTLKILDSNPDYIKNQVILKSGQLRMGKSLYKISLCVIFSCSLFTRQSQAQQVRVFNTENSGLPHNQVASITIDAKGNKWFGTFYGEVVEFDNVNWNVYNSGVIVKIAEQQGTITKVDISNFPDGFYTISITTEDKVVARKFIKKY